MSESKKAATVRDVPAAKFIETYAAALKKSGKVELPKWVDLVKTGTDKELPPFNPDWFYIRLAATARAIYLRPAGIGGMRKKFSGRQRNGVRPEHKGLGSEAVARTALQQLEKLGVLAKDTVKGGRRVSKAGQQTLDRIAAQIAATL